MSPAPLFLRHCVLVSVCATVSPFYSPLHTGQEKRGGEFGRDSISPPCHADNGRGRGGRGPGEKYRAIYGLPPWGGGSKFFSSPDYLFALGFIVA